MIEKDVTIGAVMLNSNNNETIIRALDYILNQTKKLDEIILVNDGSTINPLKQLVRLHTVWNKKMKEFYKLGYINIIIYNVNMI